MAQNSHFRSNGLKTSSISLKIYINDSLLVKKLSEQHRQILICGVAVMAKNLKMAKMAEKWSFFICLPLFTYFICKRVIGMQMYKIWCPKRKHWHCMAILTYKLNLGQKWHFSPIWPQKPLVIFWKLIHRVVYFQ